MVFVLKVGRNTQSPADTRRISNPSQNSGSVAVRFFRNSGESTARCNRMVPAQTAQVHDEAREHAFRLLPQLTRMHGPKETVCPQCQGELRRLGKRRWLTPPRRRRSRSAKTR